MIKALCYTKKDESEKERCANKVKIAVDAMGGDNAPEAIVSGVMLAKKDFPELEFQLYGKRSRN